jgi:hypothetical protein
VNDAQPLILDDVDTALGHLTELGQLVVAPVARSIRTNVLMFAAVHSWPVLDYRGFVDWASAQIDSESYWLLLDPLCCPAKLSEMVLRARLKRVATAAGLKVEGELPAEVATRISGADVTVLDDGVATGSTLCEVVRLVKSAGARVTRFVVCAARPSGRAAASAAAPDASWLSYTASAYKTVHLRDACPFVPFASRPISSQPGIETPNGTVGVSLPVTAFRGGVWGQLAVDSRLGHTIMTGRRDIAVRLSSALGRTATVADIPLLGANVMLQLGSMHKVEADSRLEDVVR